MKVIAMVSLGILLGILSVSTFAQSTASLSGTVTDPSGAVVPGAHVTVHSLVTGADRTTNTDAAGLYAVPSLQPGEYRIQATAGGFGTYTVSRVTLNVDQKVTVNMTLST